MGADEEGYWHGKHNEIYGKSARGDSQRATRDGVAQHLTIRADCATPRVARSIRRSGSRDHEEARRRSGCRAQGCGSRIRATAEALVRRATLPKQQPAQGAAKGGG